MITRREIIGLLSGAAAVRPSSAQVASLTAINAGQASGEYD
jgi:hypothetical protein